MIPPPPISPLRDRDEASLAAALCLLFELKHSEGRMLARLLTRECITKEELRAAASHDDQPIAVGSIGVFLSTLRAKLRPHNIQITTISRMGYGLRKESRGEIYRRLAESDAGFILPSESQTDKNSTLVSVNP